MKHKATYIVVGAIIGALIFFVLGRYQGFINWGKPPSGFPNWEIDEEYKTARTMSLNDNPRLAYEVNCVNPGRCRHNVFTLAYDCRTNERGVIIPIRFRSESGEEATTLNVEAVCLIRPTFLEEALEGTDLKHSSIDLLPLDPEKYDELFSNSVLLEIYMKQLFDIDRYSFIDIPDGGKIIDAIGNKISD